MKHSQDLNGRSSFHLTIQDDEVETWELSEIERCLNRIYDHHFYLCS